MTTLDDTTLNDDARARSAAPAAVTPWSWVAPTRWRCLRCGDWFLTRDLQPRCPACGFVED